MATTVTRETFAANASQRYEEVAVDGWGVIGLRSVSPMRASQRAARLFDDNGNRIDAQFDRRDLHRIVDQVMVDEQTPMFTDDDLDWLNGLDSSRLEPIHKAIYEFNGAVEKKVTSEASSES